ncbi:hypothetical protein L3X38_037601 [Prunus dulcis]|uniref:Uncharacterized protein n=1 Tax=Prunus dulcis TaxID=3755 RepID=A0AAD4V3Q0_PRUDU|nr:hypothetical protein L3X38_037601 [Prunus dulcis]
MISAKPWLSTKMISAETQLLVEDVTKVTGGPLFRPNHATSLEIQQLIRAMEMSNNLNHQRMQEATQTIPQTMATRSTSDWIDC